MPRTAAPVSSSSEDEPTSSGERLGDKDANDGREQDSLHKRRQPFDPQFYRDNGLSKGGRMKEDFTVLSELSSKIKKPANMACRVEKFGNVVETFGPRKRSWVREMGLEGLLHLAGCRLPRSLCYWLCAHLDCARKELLTPDGVRFPMSKIQVYWVLGIPFGPRAVPNKIKGPVMKKKIKQIWDAYGQIWDAETTQSFYSVVVSNAIYPLLQP